MATEKMRPKVAGASMDYRIDSVTEGEPRVAGRSVSVPGSYVVPSLECPPLHGASVAVVQLDWCPVGRAAIRHIEALVG
jgi:hypothetical protein